MELAGTITIEAAGQIGRGATVNALHRRTRQVCVKIGKGDLPVDSGGGALAQLGRGLGQFRGEDGRSGDAGQGLHKLTTVHGVAPDQLMSMMWVWAPAVTSKLASAHLAGPMFATALFEKAKGSVGIPKRLAFILPSPFTS